MKYKLDIDIKYEVLIKYAFGIEITKLAKEYRLSKDKIINLRKNNYKLFNDFLKHWSIDPEVQKFNFAPKIELSMSIVKKHYKSKFKIIDRYEYILKNEKVTINDIVNKASEILEKDNIIGFIDMQISTNKY